MLGMLSVMFKSNFHETYSSMETNVTVNLCWRRISNYLNAQVHCVILISMGLREVLKI